VYESQQKEYKGDCWQDLHKNNTTALDKVVETTNHVVKANGEGLDKIIGGNEKIHQTIKQRRRTLGGTKAVLVTDDDDEPTPNGDIPGWIGYGHAEDEHGQDDGDSLLTDPCVVEAEDEESKTDTFVTAKSTADTTLHSVKSTESETKGKSLRTAMKGKSKKLKKEKSVKWKQSENNVNNSTPASSFPSTPPKKPKKTVAPRTCPGPLRRSACNRTPKKKDSAYEY